MKEILDKTYRFGKEKFVPISFDENSFVMDWICERGGSVPEHIHKFMDEQFTVISGPVHFSMRGESFSKDNGEVVFIPRNTPHSVANKSGSAVKCRIVYSPCDDTAKMFWVGEQLNLLRPDAKNNFLVQMWVSRQLGLNEFSSANPKSIPGRFIYWLLWRILGAMALFGGWSKYESSLKSRSSFIL
ncbi:MAG: cupin domain-containing protein [Flavobacteriales bacterium]|nr:cupin domain-containing protein [Flavobacteriales bacterium]